MKYVVGIDIGGTFTDLISIDEDGVSKVIKTPSTPKDPGLAVMDGLAKLAKEYGKSLEEFMPDLERLSHGTTVSTNTVLTWTGAKVGLLCTKGFRDTLEIRFGIRENVYDYRVAQPPALAPRYLRVPITERYKWNGEELAPLNEDEVRKACKYFKEQGVEAVAICFLWSFRYPDHENRAAEIVREELPDVYVTASTEVQPEVREYWRMSTTVLNAYVGPALCSYMKHLVKEMDDTGFKGTMLITQSNAGVMSPDMACKQAARTLLSGPAGGPRAGIFFTKQLGIEDIITIDMGGTSFDVSLVKAGKPMMTLASAVGGVYHLRLPQIDVHTIGAGGGSIAWIDKFGALHVGPQASGADPGPACYNKGSMEPTITDADVILGYLNPDYFIGGEIKLRRDLAEKSIKEKIADPLGLSVIDAARAIKVISDHAMVDGISTVSVRRGEDPRRYTLVVAGGAGPVHAASLAKELGIRKLIIPKMSSIFCAVGGIIADIRHDFVTSTISRTSLLDPAELYAICENMKEKGNRVLEREGIPEDLRYFTISADMRYESQYHEIEIPIQEAELSEDGIASIVERFHEKHEELYAYRDVTETEMINLRVSAFGKVTTPRRVKMPFISKDASKYIKDTRDVYFEEEGFVATNIYDGNAMEVGNLVEGPAILEQKTTTIVIPPGAKAEVNSFGDFMVELPESL